MADLRDILSDEEPLSDEELLKYLNHSLSEEEKHAIEKKMVDSSFDNEAVEGLQKVKHKDSLNDYVQQLNKNLQQQLNAKKQRKDKRKIKDIPMQVITVIVILLLCLLGYIVIHLYQRSQRTQQQSIKITTIKDDHR